MRSTNREKQFLQHYRYKEAILGELGVVLENGKVAEEGVHEELLGRRRQYYQLWKNQFPMMERV